MRHCAIADDFQPRSVTYLKLPNQDLNSVGVNGMPFERNRAIASVQSVELSDAKR